MPSTAKKVHRKPDRSHEETSDDERLSFVVVVRSGVGSAAAKVRGTSVAKIRARDLAPANENAEIWDVEKRQAPLVSVLHLQHPPLVLDTSLIASILAASSVA